MLVIISGPSGAGKSSITKSILGPGEARVVTHTTRAPRPGEEEGSDYFFVSREEFFRMRDNGELLEHAETYGNFYGISRKAIQDALHSHTTVFVIMDPQGARIAKDLGILPKGTVTIFLKSSDGEIKQRLRCEIDGERRIQRNVSSADEMLCAGEFDYVVTNANGHQDRTLSIIRTIIEHHRA